MNTIISEAYKKGFKARMLEDTLASTPYPRHTAQWEDWRSGWGAADYDIWQGLLPLTYLTEQTP